MTVGRPLDQAGQGLDGDLQVRRDGFTLDARLAVESGGVLALLGPNGAGKSTALRTLAGLTALTGGRVDLFGRCLDDPARGMCVPAARRGVGMVFQDYLLFPHLTALENVAFGLRAAGRRRREARAVARDWLNRVGLGEHAGVRPTALSGGQAQRVALARALAPGPRLLLLDEPLAALDAGTRVQVRSELRRHLDDYAGCTVLVTHDLLDALVLADSLAVVEAGRVVQRGTPGDVARAPRTPYVARLVGLNLHRGRARGSLVEVGPGVAFPAAAPAAGDVWVAFPPAAVTLHTSVPVTGSVTRWPGRVTGLEQHTDVVRVRVAGDLDVLADVPAATVADLRLTVGSPVWAAVPPAAVRTYA